VPVRSGRPDDEISGPARQFPGGGAGAAVDVCGVPGRIQSGKDSDSVWPACTVVTLVIRPPALAGPSIQPGCEATTVMVVPAAIVYVSGPGALTGAPMATVVNGRGNRWPGDRLAR
jgi:hypothetical protein